MANGDEVPYNSLLVLSQAKRVSDTPTSLDNDYYDSTINLFKNKNSSTILQSSLNKSSFLISKAKIIEDVNENSSNRVLDYKSGAIYEGTLKDNHKFGHGTFVWPNGDKYIGEFKLNYRHGFGKFKKKRKFNLILGI